MKTKNTKPGAIPIIGVIMAVVIGVAVGIPVFLQTGADAQTQLSATNETINRVYDKEWNVTANDAACYGTFSFGEIWAYNTSGTYRLLTSGTNYTAHSNGTIDWLELAQGYSDYPANASDYNQTNVTYSCYQYNITAPTRTVIDLLPLMLGVGLLALIGFGVMRR